MPGNLLHLALLSLARLPDGPAALCEIARQVHSSQRAEFLAELTNAARELTLTGMVDAAEAVLRAMDVAVNAGRS